MIPILLAAVGGYLIGNSLKASQSAKVGSLMRELSESEEKVIGDAFEYVKDKNVDYSGSFEQFKKSFEDKVPNPEKYSEKVRNAVYQALKNSYAKGGVVLLYKYRKELEVMSDDDLAEEFERETGVYAQDIMEDIEDERDTYIDELVRRMKQTMQSRGEFADGGITEEFSYLVKVNNEKISRRKKGSANYYDRGSGKYVVTYSLIEFKGDVNNPESKKILLEITNHKLRLLKDRGGKLGVGAVGALNFFKKYGYELDIDPNLLKANEELEAKEVTKNVYVEKIISTTLLSEFYDIYEPAYIDPKVKKMGGGIMAKGGDIRKIKGNNFSQQIENAQRFKALIQKVYDDQTGDRIYPLEFIKATALTPYAIVKIDGKNYVSGEDYKGTYSHAEFMDDPTFIRALEYVDRPKIRARAKYNDGGSVMAKGGKVFEVDGKKFYFKKDGLVYDNKGLLYSGRFKNIDEAYLSVKRNEMLNKGQTRS